MSAAADIITALVTKLITIVLGIDGKKMTAGLAAVNAVTACSKGLVMKTDVPEIDGNKKFSVKGAIKACTLEAVQANIQIMISFFCKTMAKPWIETLIPLILPTPANGATLAVWLLSDAGRDTITEAVCPALQFGVCAAKAAFNGAITTMDQTPVVKTMKTVMDGLEVFLCAVSPGNVAGIDQAAAESKKYQAVLDRARQLNKFHAATGAKWDDTKKEFNCGGKPCKPSCTGECGPLFGMRAAAKDSQTSGKVAQPGGGL